MSDPLAQVSEDLAAIATLSGMVHDPHAPTTSPLLTQATHDANHPLMPGGFAMVALAHVASPEAWTNTYETREHLGLPHDHIAEEDDAWEPPLQTLEYWSEAWRVELGTPVERPTVATEAAFLRSVLTWAWDHEPHWDDFAHDVERCRRRLESLLSEGDRPVLGAPCLYDECQGKRLQREVVEIKRGRWALSDWTCPRCKRTWDERTYEGMVAMAHELTKSERIGEDTWCSQDYAARMVDRSVKTVRTWVESGLVAQACIIRGRRRGFVLLADVEREDERARRRRRRTTAA